MLINEEVWGQVPLLHIIEERYANTEVPVVLFLHGFTSAKEHNLHIAYNLAKNGIRVLLPDAYLHGARSEKLNEVELGFRFWDVVLKSIEEISILRDELQNRKLLSTAKIGVAGTSMGGITTLGSLKMYNWIHAGAVLMGAPNFEELANAQISQLERKGYKLPITEDEKNRVVEDLTRFDITKDQSSLNQRPLYFWHGKNDTVVPYETTFKFYQAVKEDYKDVPERLVFESDDIAVHKVTRPAMLSAVNWLASHLKE